MINNFVVYMFCGRDTCINLTADAWLVRDKYYPGSICLLIDLPFNRYVYKFHLISS